MTIQPTYYQSAAVDNTVNWLCSNSGNPLTVLPVGTGKSIILNNLTRFFVNDYSKARILHLTHVKELISQNYSALKRMWPDAPAGCYSASLGKRDLFSQIVFGGIQSIHDKAKMLGNVDAVVVDEAHMCPFNSDTMYRRFFDDLLEINPNMRIVGLTATPYRLNGGDLRHGKNAIFHGVAYEYPIADAFNDGYLTPLHSRPGDVKIDTSGVGTRGGEFISKQLQEASDLDSINRAAVQEIIYFGKTENRKAWLVFCTGVKHAEHVCAEFMRNNITCAVVHGGTPTAQRDKILAAFARGDLQCVVNVDCLTTGYDNPRIDLLAFLRPTTSPGLWIQSLGRGTRLIDKSFFGLQSPDARIEAILASAKPNCRVLDFAHNTKRLGTIDNIVPPPTPGEKKRKGEAPIKECPQCGDFAYTSVRVCSGCGYTFPPPQNKLHATADTSAILASQIVAEWLDVTAVDYRFAMEKDKPVLETVYKCGIMVHTDRVRFEHDGYARKKADEWWALHAPGTRTPQSVREALARVGGLPKPVKICVKPKMVNGKMYRNVVGRGFAR